MLSHKELVTAILKQRGIHQGRWALAVQFGLAATNVGQSADDLNPAAIVPVMSIGIRPDPAESNLSVDAAEVNPAT
jgi:hypothetical protein